MVSGVWSSGGLVSVVSFVRAMEWTLLDKREFFSVFAGVCRMVPGGPSGLARTFRGRVRGKVVSGEWLGETGFVEGVGQMAQRERCGEWSVSGVWWSGDLVRGGRINLGLAYASDYLVWWSGWEFLNGCAFRNVFLRLIVQKVGGLAEDGIDGCCCGTVICVDADSLERGDFLN